MKKPSNCSLHVECTGVDVTRETINTFQGLSEFGILTDWFEWDPRTAAPSFPWFAYFPSTLQMYQNIGRKSKIGTTF